MNERRSALLREGTGRLAQAGIPDPARDARLLLRWACGMSGVALSASLDEPASAKEKTRFCDAIERRAARRPLSHITGTREFWGRAFAVTPDVLDPRPETETLVTEALHRGPFERVLDLGTGSGCLLVTLLAEWPEASGLGIDISGAALKIAALNARTHDVASRVAFRETSWLDGIDGPFDLVVSNPPYIAEAEVCALAPEVRDFEPRAALTPGGDGLESYRTIAAGIAAVLGPGGLLMVEIGPAQSHEVSALLAGAGLNVRAIIPDLDQRARVIVAQA